MTNQQLTERFSTMILGVRNSDSLLQNEKEYIIELLQDQLSVELICLEYADPMSGVSGLMERE